MFMKENTEIGAKFFFNAPSILSPKYNHLNILVQFLLDLSSGV